MSVSHDTDGGMIENTVDDTISSASSTGLKRTMLDETSEINRIANEFESDLTKENAKDILETIFNGRIDTFNRESLCQIVKILEPNFQSGGRGENINKQQIHHAAVGVNQKVQVSC